VTVHLPADAEWKIDYYFTPLGCEVSLRPPRRTLEPPETSHSEIPTGETPSSAAAAIKQCWDCSISAGLRRPLLLKSSSRPKPRGGTFFKLKQHEKHDAHCHDCRAALERDRTGIEETLRIRI
jgi:hypothetical protein